MFKNFTYFSKTNIGALVGAAGLYLRATGKGDVADTNNTKKFCDAVSAVG